tara:strand:+ start:7991 stop:8317 length:327 start_codon:yes stop_codon:yes gene_type:complete
MARLDEIAEGVSSVLASSPMPEPLFLEMVGHSPSEVTFLIRSVVDACERRGVPLSKVCVGPSLGSNAKRALGPEPLHYQGVQVDLVDGLDRGIEFYRFPVSDVSLPNL